MGDLPPYKHITTHREKKKFSKNTESILLEIVIHSIIWLYVTAWLYVLRELIDQKENISSF